MCSLIIYYVLDLSKDFGELIERIAKQAIAKSAARVALLVAIGMVLFLSLFWLTGRLSILLLPLLIGLGVALWEDSPVLAAAETALILFIGALLGRAYLSLSSFQEIIQALPAHFILNTERYAFEVVGRLAGANPLAAPAKQAAWLLSVGIMLLVGVLISIVISNLKGKGKIGEKIISLALVILISVSFIYSTVSTTGDFRSRLLVEPADEKYDYDHLIYLKTYYLMGQGQGYYPALVDAALKDKRINSLQQWLHGPLFIRQPTVFYIWRMLAPQASYIFYWSLALAVLAVWLLRFGLEKLAGGRIAVISIALLLPYLIIGSTWANILLSDWWASLLVLGAFGLIFRGRYLPAAVLALLAALIRETTALLILSALVGGLIARDRRVIWPFTGAALLFAPLFLIHYSTAYSILAGKVPGAGLPALYSGVHFVALRDAASFLIFPYGYGRIPGLVFLALGLLGAISAPDKVSRTTITMYLSGFMAYMLFMNTSSYWGQKIVMPALIAIPLTLSLFTKRGHTSCPQAGGLSAKGNSAHSDAVGD